MTKLEWNVVLAAIKLQHSLWSSRALLYGDLLPKEVQRRSAALQKALDALDGHVVCRFARRQARERERRAAL